MKPNEAAIAGKRVTFRERFSLRENRDLPRALAACGEEDTEQNNKIAVLSRCIDSWEFPGSPSDAAAYEDLDLFTEFVPLMVALGEYLQARMGNLSTTAKNLASASS